MADPVTVAVAERLACAAVSVEMPADAPGAPDAGVYAADGDVGVERWGVVTKRR